MINIKNVQTRSSSFNYASNGSHYPTKAASIFFPFLLFEKNLTLFYELEILDRFSCKLCYSYCSFTLGNLL